VKIFTSQASLLGKKEYKDIRLEKLKEKFKSAKISFYRVEFTNENIFSCDCILIKEDELLDLVIEDMEKIESLWGRVEEKILKKAYQILEKGKPLADSLAEEEINQLKNYNLITLKPVVFLKEKFLWEDIFKAMHLIFFFTANKNEAKAYCVKEGTDIVSCAAKIHTDLAKGFIRGEVFNCQDLDKFSNIEEAKSRGFLKIVGRDYIVNDGDVINIKFKV